MWALLNRTAYAAERNWTRGKDGDHFWIVAVRATFDISKEGKLRLADEQLPPVLAPEYFGEPGLSSLRYDSDLLALKPGTDLIVNACAHAPNGKPASAVEVSLQVQKLRKVLRVRGSSVYVWSAGFLKATSPQPFTSRQIRYEWAYGGLDTIDPDPRKHRIDSRNPIGKGFASTDAHLKDQPAHCIEYPSGDMKKAGPAGFGAIDRSWSPRREYAGTYDDRWAAGKKPLLPDDYDDRFALCSPADQRPAARLQGGEEIELTNMTAAGALRFQLPRIRLEYATQFGPRTEDHGDVLASVVIEPEEMRLTMVWQSSLRVPPRDAEYLDRTTVVERPGA